MVAPAVGSRLYAWGLTSTPCAGVYGACMSSLGLIWVLPFPPTVQIRAVRQIGASKMPLACQNTSASVACVFQNTFQAFRDPVLVKRL